MKYIFKIFSFTRSFWKFYLFMGFFITATSLLSLVSPILFKNIVDIIVKEVQTGKADFRPIIIYLILIIGSDVLSTTLTSVSEWVGDILAVRMETYLTRKFYEHLLRLDIGFYDAEITGQITNKMYRGIESISNFVNNAANNFLPFIMTAVVTIGLLAFYSPFIAVLLTVLFPIYIIISHSSTVAWSKRENEKNIIRDSSQGRVFESISGIRVVKAFVAELAEHASFLKARKNIEKITVGQTRQWHIYDFVRQLVLNIILFIIFAYIIYYTFNGRYTIGDMTLMVQLVNQARFPLFAMSFILGQIQRANAGSKDFFDLLDTEVRVRDRRDAGKLRIGKQRKGEPIIEFANVTFGYEKDKTVLKDVSFAVRRGETLALVGESGQGKSTLANLILRFYEPQQGQISVAGKNIAAVTQESLRSHVAVVFQESLLFSGTIRENILYGQPDASQSEVVRVAKAANAHEFIYDLPDGYDSVIGERGVKLSGGQKQRIAIARAMLKDAPIIILDEATSSLDSRSELLVQQGLERLMRGRTTVIIAHRLSTIASADHILVLSGGHIAQYGKPAELLKDGNGLYAQMVNLQNTLLTATPEERDEALQKFDLVA